MEDICFSSGGLLINISTSYVFVNVIVYQGDATIHYNKLQADPKQGKSLDIGIFSTSHTHTHFQSRSLFVYITFCGLCIVMLCFAFFHYHSNYYPVLWCVLNTYFVCFSAEKGQTSACREYELRHSRRSWTQQSYSLQW